MQRVSDAYKRSMKSPLRERAYIMLSFGLINQESQEKATIFNEGLTYYANSDSVFNKGNDAIVYATLEENLTKVDGSMVFLPRDNSLNVFYDTGIVTNDVVSNGTVEVVINTNILATNYKGFTINFGENYPTSFDIIGSNNQTLEYRNNTDSLFSTEDVLDNTTQITIKVYSMKNPNSRLRIYSILFGYGITCYNNDVITSSLESYISPIGADVPQIDFTVKLKNLQRYFDADNPKSALNFLETGQRMEVWYGYQLPDDGGVEWIKGNTLLCSEWESDDTSATIRCQDIFRGLDTEYYKGTYNTNGTSYYELATSILEDAGIEEYYIDPRLKTLFTKNPIPRVKHKEALQIVANACRCVLSQTRDGKIQIKSNFVPESFASSESATNYSNVSEIMNGLNKDEYSSFATDYTTVDNSMFFLPRNETAASINTGFVSSEISGADCTFTTNPVITITQEAVCMYYGLKICFGATHPSEFIIRTYKEDETVETYVCSEQDIKKETIIYHAFMDFDTMKIEFKKTNQPYQRIIVNNFSFGDITDFTMSKMDMTSFPKTIKQEVVKSVIVPCLLYQNGESEESLISETVTVKNNDVVTFFVGEPSYNFRAVIENMDNGVTMLESGSYYVKLKFNFDGTKKLNVYGYRYKIVTQDIVHTLNAQGRTIRWENPLMSDAYMASDLAEWISDYYNFGVEYEFSTRGNPEIDANDIIYQANDFVENMKVNVYRQTLKFEQSFSGKVTTRRIGG